MLTYIISFAGSRRLCIHESLPEGAFTVTACDNLETTPRRVGIAIENDTWHYVIRLKTSVYVLSLRVAFSTITHILR